MLYEVITIVSSVASALPSAAGQPSTTTTITTYSYNADGALTAITKQPGGEPAVTTYVTWDSYTFV